MGKKMLLLNAPLRGYPKDTKLPIEVDKTDKPSEMYWRDRLKDAEIDNCVEWVTKKKPAKSTITTEVTSNGN